MKRFFIWSMMIAGVYGQSLWTESDGVAIRQGVHIEWQRTVCPGDNGSVIVVWSDTRNGNRELYAQKISTDGQMLWSDDGKAVTQLPGRQEDPVAIGDGAGGAFIAWVDYRYDIAGDIFVQHLDANGDPLMDSDGIALCQQPNAQITINMCTDGNGGVYVTWQDGRSGVNQDIYGTHISANNDVINPGSGTSIAAAAGNQTSKSIEYAGEGEALLVWTDSRISNNAEIYSQRLDAGMNAIFEQDGINISSTSNLDGFPRTTYMHGDTSFVTWQHGEETAIIWYNLITSDGVVFENHRTLSNVTALQTAPRVKNDSIGEVFITWTDHRADTTNGEIYTQKIDANGDIAWDSAGIALDMSGYVNKDARFVSDELGGAWYFWQRGIFPEIDVISLHIEMDQSTTEYIVSDVSGEQSSPIGMSDANTGAYVIFADIQTKSVWLRVQRVTPDGLQYESGGRLLKEGLDGNVKFVSHGSNNNGIVLSWEDTRSARNAFGSWISPEGYLANYNGKHTTYYNINIKEETNPIPQVLLTDDSFYSLSYSTETGASLIHINKMDYNLDNVWDSLGVNIYESNGDQISPILFDTPSGLGCIWSDFTNFTDYDIYYQILDESGNPLLTTPGILIADNLYVDDYAVAVIPTPDDQLLVILYEQVAQNEKYIAKKMSYDGTVDMDWNGGRLVLAGPYFGPQNLIVKTVDSTGVLLAWNEYNNFAFDIKTQMLMWDGSTAWQAGGIYATTRANDQANMAIDITPDNNIALIVWEDFENGTDYNIAGQLIDLQGASFVGDNIQITTDTSFQYLPSVKNLNNDKFLIVWEDERGIYNPDPTKAIGVDLYQTTLTVSTQGLTIDGDPLIQEFHRQESIHFADLSENELLMYWVDLRASGKEDFYSLYGKLYVTSDFVSLFDEQVPETFRISNAFPNPFNGTTMIQVDVVEISPIQIQISNLLGQTVYSATVMPEKAGRYELSWNGTDIFHRQVSSGIYLYKISISDVINRGKVTYLK